MQQRQLTLAFVVAAAVALAAQVRVPMEPVPMTLQTLALFVGAALVGARTAAWAAAIYLLAAWLGAPVLSGFGTIGVGGMFVSKTAGYVVAMVPAAWLVGRAGDARWPGLFVAVVGAHAVVLLVGGAWLAAHVGVEAAWQKGVVPFFVGALVKSALVPLLVSVLRRRPNA